MGPTIEEPPAQYIQRLVQEGRLFVGFDLGEQMLSYAVERAGAGGFVYATDFPHEGFRVEHARHEIEELLGRRDLSDEAKEAVLANNARRLYGLT
jgi:predicted TIM-barrel fold metal-dependent hydrolase